MKNPSRGLRSILTAIQLRRITTSVAYMPAIDGIRFVAIFSVIIYHIADDVTVHSTPFQTASMASSWEFWVANRLSIGVQAFFVLSGFVLALPFARHYLQDKPAPQLRRYYLRRLTRLEPPYVLAMLYFFALNVVRRRATIAMLLPHLIASILYQHNLIYGRPSDLERVAWSLEVEVQFYILAPAMAALALRWRSRRLRRVGIVASVIVAGAVATKLRALWPWTSISLIGQLPYFTVGLLLADIFVTENAIRPRLGWDIASVLAALLVFLGIYFEPVTLYVVPFLLFAAFYGAFHGVVLKSLLSKTFVSTVGGMCYSIYLFHKYGISLCGRYSETIGRTLPFTTRLILQLILMTPVILAISGIFFVLVERPCMQPDWPQRLKRRWLDVRAAERLEEPG